MCWFQYYNVELILYDFGIRMRLLKELVPGKLHFLFVFQVWCEHAASQRFSLKPNDLFCLFVDHVLYKYKNHETICKNTGLIFLFWARAGPDGKVFWALCCYWVFLALICYWVFLALCCYWVFLALCCYVYLGAPPGKAFALSK